MTSSAGDGTRGVREQLQPIYDALRRGSAWPTFEQVDILFDHQLEIADTQGALTALSPRYLRVPSQPWVFRDYDEVQLTLTGILECDGGSGDLQLLVEFIRWGAQCERNSDYDEPTILRSADFANHADLPIMIGQSDAPVNDRVAFNRDKIARLRLLTELLPRFWKSTSQPAQWPLSDKWEWSLKLDRRIFRPYRAIQNVEQLLGYAENLTSGTTVSQDSVETASDDAGNGDPSTYVAAHAALTVTPRFGAIPTVEQESGVEADDTSAGTIDEPFDPEHIDVATRNPTVDLLLSRLRRGALDLQPEFQRMAGIWPDQSQSRLIESMLLRIPLPTFYAAESDDDNWRIVDGVQRLTAIARFVDPGAIEQSTPLVLGGLEYLGRQYEGKTFADLPGRFQTRILETELVVHLIRPGTPEPAMFNIFVRINTGGRPLTRQELRHALIPGPARELLGDLASAEPFLRATLGSVSPKRMDDREMVLRFIAFRSTGADKYRPEFDEFLRMAMKDANKLGPVGMAELESDFNRAMDGAHQVFGGHAFRKRYPGQTRRSPINKALFESVAVNLAELSDSEIDILVRRRDDVLEELSDLLDTVPEFDRSISVATGDAAKVRFRFKAIRQLFREILND